MRNRIGNILFGIIILVLGIGFCGEALDLWNFNVFFNGWWTLFIIVPCFVNVVKSGFNIANSFGIIVGTLLLLDAQGIIDDVNVRKIIGPIILILIGITIIYKELFKKNFKFRSINKFINKSGQLDVVAIFGGQDLRHPNEKFNGGTVTAIFGGIDLDLSNAIITEDVKLNITSIFGGTDVKVPGNVKIKMSSVPIFGGASNKANTPIGENFPTIHINAVNIFGGTEIKN